MVYTKIFQRLNPLSPHDALKHHFTSLKTDLIFLQLTVSERNFHKLPINFYNFYTTSNHLYPLQVENCDSSSRLVVDKMTMVNSGLKGLRVNLFTRHFINQRNIFKIAGTTLPQIYIPSH